MDDKRYTFDEIMAVARERVALGRQWLVTEGANRGFNILRLDRDTLDLGSGSHCALAQTFHTSDYVDALHAAVDKGGKESPKDWDMRANAWAAEHGFQHGICFTDKGPIPDIGHLEEAWKETLR